MDMGRRRVMKGMLGGTAALMLPGDRVFSQVLGDHRLVEVSHSTFVMGQIANVTLFVHDRTLGANAATAIFEEFRRLERGLSIYDERSDVARLNAAAGRESVNVGPELLAILQSVLEISYALDGSLDLTIEPLMRLWGFRGDRGPNPPTDAEIVHALSRVGHQNILLERGAVGLAQSGCAIDLGGVAVGYALDRAAAIARRMGVERGLIELSGDYYAIGSPPDADGWTIGLEDPRVAYGLWGAPTIRDQGLSTSGNYNTVVVYNAHRFGHIMDPSLGEPSRSHLSTTVIAPTAFQADTLSTAYFVSGERDARDPSIRVMQLDLP